MDEKELEEWIYEAIWEEFFIKKASIAEISCDWGMDISAIEEIIRKFFLVFYEYEMYD